MDDRPRAHGSAFVGRAEELATVGALLAHAAEGSAGALVISGDPGVGKTTLVDRACTRADPAAMVLTGVCLPLSAMTIPFLALRSALRSIGPAFDLPVGLRDIDESPSSVPIAFDKWLVDLCRDRPVILRIDDLHWADQSTLDVLMYVLAGPAERNLAVVATVRSSEVRKGHPLHRWLSSVLRLPRVQQLDLDPLNRVATSEQLADLMGASPHQSLVEEIFTRTRGNAYLNRLLVKDLSPNARSLSIDLPVDLTSAVLAEWWTLPDQTRDLTLALAAGGEPMTPSDLAPLSGRGITTDQTRSSLLEAREAGILDQSPQGSYWFHHPMIAEALEQNLTDDERVRWHAASARRGEEQLALIDSPPLELMISVAGHFDRAGHLSQAYEWSIRAAGSTGPAGGSAEMLRLLQRALELGRQLPGVQESERDLLEQLVAAAALTGANREELGAVDLLIELIDPRTEPLLMAELLLRRADLRFLTGCAFLSEQDVRTALDLASTADPDSWQCAFALAAVVAVAAWHDDQDVEPMAERALTVARQAGNPMALSRALSTRAMVATSSGRDDEGLRLAEEAVSTAERAGDYFAFVCATFEEINAMAGASPILRATHLHRRGEQMAARGAPHNYSAVLCATEADNWLTVGDGTACQEALRLALGANPGPLTDVYARLVAARLAAGQGRVHEARSHLTRADEVIAEGSSFLGFTFDVTRATVLLAAGSPEAAVDAALSGAMSTGFPPDRCEWLMPLAARALADLIETDRDSGQDPLDHASRLENLIERFPRVILDVGLPYGRDAEHVIALEDLYQAEVGRAQRHADNADQWLRAVNSSHTAMLAWEEAYVCWRAAESLLARGRQRRDAAAPVLRRGLTLATRLGAEPTRTRLERLASSARIEVANEIEVPPGGLAELAHLTTREREILSYVIAGRTYREIAHALVISEKTVSSHISNLLRKTGAENRVDLSRLATRSTKTTLSE